MIVMVDFYFDFLSPFSYLANHRLSVLAGRYGFSIQYHAIDLARAKTAIGNIGPSNRDLKVKLDYLKVDLQRWADLYRIPLVFPPNFNSRRVNAGLYYPAARERAAEYVRLVFDSAWGKGWALDADSLLAEVCDKLNWDLGEFEDFLNSENAAKAYDEETQAAIDRKVFGVPTVFWDDQMWWGNDRLFMLESRLQKETQP
ncbi:MULTISPECIES: 2-hydroxychromene-2-carboxylate isomerase [Pseudomonadota]|jgi:2-hydroxychromene-2-carboxylate isomerase|uniref:2-hydroxychromene-2-carboxylate isomerase n=2 Tax=Burkholderiales TaxID=80840 RepID=G9I2S9_9BURK|nr:MULTISPECIES: 2-hydroxychromene-2-carboxylate isomerase [Pseudomonadota]AAD12617.1 2-hydroxychromene carboxylate isomerase [Ralstonia sp. U2]AEV41421.1 2-hydroxychromene carboxylate isomerase [uncultured Acidovorax sp.]KGG89615.1 2-hydroxychromene-2-carboxylate isomerase [Comamonas thiooxydans]KGG97346.1 2-hydroxychromene-2-carboxylate isomerase [Comamonas thiooxydans]KGH01118.1 2-hydroxychromene-2-carboxylate isomerase [Comamonas thiooxydans]